MIISHKHKFIFIKTRKTASTSMEIALSSICGKDDIITPISYIDEKERKRLGYYEAQNYYKPFSKYRIGDFFKLIKEKKRVQFYNHISAAEIKTEIGTKVWETYFKFTFDRNPFDKAVSFFYWKAQQQDSKDINEFIKNNGFTNMRSYDIYSINKIVAVDKIYKYEEIDQAMIDISNKIGLSEPLKMPEYKAKSGIRKTKSYKDILNTESIKTIEIAFSREIKLLNYTY